MAIEIKKEEKQEEPTLMDLYEQKTADAVGGKVVGKAVVVEKVVEKPYGAITLHVLTISQKTNPGEEGNPEVKIFELNDGCLVDTLDLGKFPLENIEVHEPEKAGELGWVRYSGTRDGYFCFLQVNQDRTFDKKISPIIKTEQPNGKEVGVFQAK